MTFSEFFLNIFRFIINPSVIKKIKDTKNIFLVLQFVFLIIMLAFSFAHTLHHNVFQPTFQQLFKFIPASENITIQNGKAVFPEGITLPHVRSIELGGSKTKKFYYILDTGDNTEDIKTKYNDFVLFTSDKAILEFNSKSQAISYSQIEGTSFKKFFGNPFTVSAENLSNFCSWALSFSLLLFLPPFFILPLPIILGTASLVIVFVLTLALLPFFSSQYKFLEIFKFTLFALTPAIFIQSFACLVLSGNLLFVFFLLSYLLQFTYVLYGLKNK